ncbi:uncharacterized protein LOC129314510 isoform X2 [Prosopis cineraria]|uniref:uncharacterized protein LOC129314510 isoform X2 n=1 Tax=Prosopis cineraria TaxID=364024 RepID=UPI00240FB30F|nr:uncharacterized protein LOC129314510 isoform X2 [Prosopis cineraria]
MSKLGNEKISWILSVVFCFFLSSVLAMATTGDGGFAKELEVEKILKTLNKPAVKSIKRDSYNNTGCYNLRCPGFVQVDPTVVVGSSLQNNISVYGGSQYVLSIHIRKDQTTGNWWMQVGNTSVGYWPASLFNHMSVGASHVKWGGEIVNKGSNGQHTTTGMGSGHFPEEGYGKASFFKHISIVDANNSLASPKSFNPYVTNAYCYNITSYDYSNDSGVYFYYGGPGRNSNCP